MGAAPPPVMPPRDVVDEIVRRALAEDVAWGDATTRALVPTDLQARADVVVKERAMIAGLPMLQAVYRAVDPSCRVEMRAEDGREVERGGVVATVHGPAAALLTGERVALNFLQRLAGTATMTAAFVRAVRGTKAIIVDTRKTTPGLRALEKYAVRVGGGQNHRHNLADGVLIKDNHLAALALRGLGIADAVRLARASAPHTLKVEVEVETLDQVRQAVGAGADILLLDNMPPAMLAEAVHLAAGKAVTEASGGIRLETVRAVAESGVDLISIGALTHSAPSIDISLDFHLAATSP